MIEPPYLLFLGDAHDQLAAKTAQGIVDWRRERCFGQLRLEGCTADLGLADRTIKEAQAAGVRTFVVGVANQGGFFPEHWTAAIAEGLEAGFDVAHGLHVRLSAMPALKEAAERTRRRILDVRHPSREFGTGTGSKRSGKRLLTVGTDCSCGKMYTTLALEKEMRARGINADFRATGQTGILIAGEGVSIDAVVADFISGATEWLAPEAAPEHWDVIEGQGSLFHPAYAGVSLGLLHGAQPDAIVMCHEPTRRHMRGLPHQPLPPIPACIAANLEAARLTNPAVRCIGLSVNTAALPLAQARFCLENLEREHGMPAVDPMRDGVGRLVDRLP